MCDEIIMHIIVIKKLSICGLPTMPNVVLGALSPCFYLISTASLTAFTCHCFTEKGDAEKHARSLTSSKWLHQDRSLDVSDSQIHEDNIQQPSY